VTGDRPVRISGSLEMDMTRAAQRLATLVVAELDVLRTADRIADLVAAKLVERRLVVTLPDHRANEPHTPSGAIGVPADGDDETRKTEYFDLGEMPPRGTVRSNLDDWGP
jgi:hypothetical protein